ncbi:GH116 family glycosyl hydrolase [Pedobacter frigoris]|uniref:Twin-arginine translocation signal domain-containing protein n=1 Tax=Pedobacter frigoris TaxID=2571272 RepID=A0A4U1CCE8_9SPHI|nr:GH116 family glycosyl hydrolase [Pedobacter frigoris]TKC03622.1 twin-arginine translocation signal domain-containing protein [Pedobacter frigoris]
MNNKTVDRRDFIKKAGLLTAGFAALQFPVWAQSIFAEGYPLHNIPENKGIDPAWARSLFNRGDATTYLKSRNELKYIGMPAGGLHAGTVYVGGDGRLWLWQIYNETFEGPQEGIDPKVVNWNDGTSVRKIRVRDGAAYVEPAIANNKRVLDQGFAIKAIVNGKTIVKELNEDDWEEVSFTASYPVANIKYSSKGFPLEVNLKVYSPFIPLDAEKSALPATILKLEAVNKGKSPLNVSVLGWMENGVNKLTGKAKTGQRKNEVISLEKSTGIFSSFETTNEEVRGATDSGSMSFVLHGTKGRAQTSFSPWPVEGKHFDVAAMSPANVEAPEKLVGSLGFSEHLLPGKSLKANYSVSWHFNNVNPKLKKLVKNAEAGYHYGARFKDARAVSEFINANFNELSSTTELWSNTWNNSTLPHWFLERTFVNIGTLATANTYRFADGRFWGWEGVGACAGTCTHVWQYAQAVGRIFPELERGLREKVDLGVGFKEDSGAIIFRAENESRPAIDGQAGTVLRFYREHQMSKDSTFLQTNWPKIKKAIQFMLSQDKNGDGMTDTPMENTLDAVWEGEIAWIVGLCIAAARAGQAMAEEMKDDTFAKICENYVSNGRRNMEKELFNGEYFIHRPDAVQGRKNLGSYNTCHIDQVYGQSWAFQVGLPRVLDKAKAIAALKALWKYNFTMDVGPYIKTHTGGRPYALSGEGGMVMNTNPRNEPKPFGENISWQLGYFHECMSGFEHQVAAHFMAEGMLEESLVLTRVIHDRHHAAKRNPFNEIECSDHYARAMASYGTFITACGFEYHGPKGYIAFAPKWNKENFKAPFTSAEGWGTYHQQKSGLKQIHNLELKYGTLALNKLSFEKLGGAKVSSVSAQLGGRQIPSTFKQENNAVDILVKERLNVQKNQILTITIS